MDLPPLNDAGVTAGPSATPWIPLFGDGNCPVVVSAVATPVEDTFQVVASSPHTMIMAYPNVPMLSKVIPTCWLSVVQGTAKWVLRGPAPTETPAFAILYTFLPRAANTS